MSSGKIQDKSVYFEVNSNGIVGEFFIAQLDGDEFNPDKIIIKMMTQSGGHGASSTNSTSVTIPKSHTQVLANWFREAAKAMDEWYKEEK